MHTVAGMNDETDFSIARCAGQIEAQYADFVRQAGARRPQMAETRGAVDELVTLAAVDSTNILARKLMASGGLSVIDAQGGPRLIAICADVQSAGHGRLGRKWGDKAGGASLLVTFCTALPERLVSNSHYNGWFTIIAGLAALDALHGALAECGAKPLDRAGDLELKWPNDIFYEGHKLGGILSEMVSLPQRTGRFNIARGMEENGDETREPAVGLMFGIGINLDIARENLPTPISTSLQLLYGPLPDSARMRDMVAARLAVSLKRRLATFVADPQTELPKLLGETRSRCWTLGRQVEARFIDGSTLVGTALSLNADASLTIQDGSGACHVVKTGDVGVLA